MVTDCPYPAKKAKRKCDWHWLLTQPAGIQRNYGLVRLGVWIGLHGDDRKMRIPSGEWPDGERWCSGCQSFVPLFYVSGSRCKSCNSTASHAKSVEDKYGITEERYQEMSQRQGGRCAICRNRPRAMRLAVDHDHQSGEVRGLLCKRCNHDLLGGGHDSVDILWRAVGYLLFPPAQNRSEPGSGDVYDALLARMTIRARLRDPRPSNDDPPPF